MDKVKVYSFWSYDGNTDKSTPHPIKRTAERIKELGCEIIPDTEEEVDEADLDDDGRYDPSKA